MPTAAYDEIADWYEHEFLRPSPEGAPTDVIGSRRALATLLGRGATTCLDIGCGTGASADDLRALGWQPVGVDLSRARLRHGRDRLPVAVSSSTDSSRLASCWNAS